MMWKCEYKPGFQQTVQFSLGFDCKKLLFCTVLTGGAQQTQLSLITSISRVKRVIPGCFFGVTSNKGTSQKVPIFYAIISKEEIKRELENNAGRKARSSEGVIEKWRSTAAGDQVDMPVCPLSEVGKFGLIVRLEDQFTGSRLSNTDTLWQTG